MKNIFICFLPILVASHSFAQKISSTLFNETVLAENFDIEGEYFPIMVNRDNYFVLDKGDYLVSRNNQETEYAIIAKTTMLTNFSLKTKLKLAPSKNILSSIGVLLKTQINAVNSIIVEINGNGEYRIKTLRNSIYKNISIKEKNNGWIYNKVINKANKYNILEIRCNKNIYELYINNVYLDSFLLEEYNTGLCGLIINPDTKARIAYYYIKSKEGEVQSKKILNTAYTNNQELESHGNQTKNTDLYTTIIELRKEIKNKEKEIENLEEKLQIAINTIQELKNENTILQETEDNKSILQQENNDLKEKIINLNNISDALKKEQLSIRNKMENIKKENEKLNNQIKKHRKITENKKNLENEIANKNKKISINQDITQKIRSELKQTQKELSDMNNKNQENISHIKTLETQNKSLSIDFEITKQKLIEEKNNIQNLKELFVSKDFRLNGLTPSSAQSSITTYPTPKDIQDSKYIYTIQIAAYAKKINISNFQQIKNVKYNQLENGIFIYISGEFNSVIEATKYQNKLKKKGYKDAFIIKIKK